MKRFLSNSQFHIFETLTINLVLDIKSTHLIYGPRYYMKPKINDYPLLSCYIDRIDI